MTKQATPEFIEIFRVGRHTATDGAVRSFGEADVSACAAAYDPALHEAPLCVGHPKDNLPAYGWVKSLQVRDGVLSIQPHQVDPAFAEMVNAGRFKKRSASFYAPDSPANPKPGTWYLRHVAFLGAQPPAVKGLRDASFADGEQGVVEFGDWEDRTVAGLFRRIRDYLIGAAGLETADKVLPDYEINALQEAAMRPSESDVSATPAYKEGNPPVSALTAEQLAAEKAELDKRAAAITAREQAEAARQAAERKAGIASFCEGLVKAGQLKPADRERVQGLLASLPDASVIEFGEGDKKTEQPALQVMKDWLSGLPKLLEFGEHGKAKGAAVADADELDPKEVSDRATAWKSKRAAAGVEISFTEAVDAVRAGKDLEGVK
ncbi:MAG: hypothetical protein KIT35_21860 [Piscinibacter sp.]|uniref:hypothetical protein n=1 Tax=Piscinibacter sp. TaxID=1903157 RepID=UPI002587A589|nr:hypothetical protein [Piscinibacter sp.]MCW5666486.1 hypothetical protein [Piscinibacter sp.]